MSLSALISSALMVLNLLLFEFILAVSTAPDILRIGFMLGVLVSLPEATDAASEGTVVLGIIAGNELFASAMAEVLEGTGFDFTTNPVGPDDVDASTLVLSAVAKNNALPSEAVDADAEVLAFPAVGEHIVIVSAEQRRLEYGLDW